MAIRVAGAGLLILLGACAAEEAPIADEDFGGPGGKADADDVPLAFRSYEVLFTNPLCRSYSYEEPVPSVDEQSMLEGKPKNVYCTKTDQAASGARPESPQFRLVEWVKALGAGDEIFLAYLSFSNSAMGNELCAAAKRGVDVTFVLDAPTDLSSKLEGCGGTVILRGHTEDIGFAHNKLILINAREPGPGDPDPDFMRMTFSSGNMSSGVVAHHENWHFIEVARESFFAEAHQCLRRAQLDDEASSSREAYGDFLKECRMSIPFPEETDIKAFFVPAPFDSRRAERYMLGGIDRSAAVDVGAHRFGHPGLVGSLEQRLFDDESFSVRMVADDDLYWLAPLTGEPHQNGDNDTFEADNVDSLVRAGDGRFAIKYMETNHGEHLLHHNKFLIYRDDQERPFAVLCGAANLTGTGFSVNFENIYYVRIPTVLDQFDAQFARFWDGERADENEQDPPMATAPEKMPQEDLPAF